MKEKVAEKIRLLRLSKNYSQQNIADELGITVAAYSNIERGVTDITVTRLFQISRILEVSPATLIREDNLYITNDDDPTNEKQHSELMAMIRDLQSQMSDLQKEMDSLRKPRPGRPRRAK